MHFTTERNPKNGSAIDWNHWTADWQKRKQSADQDVHVNKMSSNREITQGSNSTPLEKRHIRTIFAPITNPINSVAGSYTWGGFSLRISSHNFAWNSHLSHDPPMNTYQKSASSHSALLPQTECGIRLVLSICTYHSMFFGSRSSEMTKMGGNVLVKLPLSEFNAWSQRMSVSVSILVMFSTT